METQYAISKWNLTVTTGVFTLDYDGFDLTAPAYGLSEAQCQASCLAWAGCRQALYRPRSTKCSLKSYFLEDIFLLTLEPSSAFGMAINGLAGDGEPSVVNLQPRQTARGLPLDFLCTFQRSFNASSSQVLRVMTVAGPELCARACMRRLDCAGIEHTMGAAGPGMQPGPAACTLLVGPFPQVLQPPPSPATAHACLRLSTATAPRLTLTSVSDMASTGSIQLSDLLTTASCPLADVKLSFSGYDPGGLLLGTTFFDTLLVEASSCHQLCLGTWTSAAAAAIADGVGGVGDGGDSDSEYRMIT